MKSDKKSSDAVFSFTLIDLLVQVIFLGLLVFAVTHESMDSEVTALKKELSEKEDSRGKYKELTDRLTTLSPNYEQLIRELEIKKGKRGLDKPSCLRTVDGKIESLANLLLVDNRIEFIESNDNLEKVLKDLGQTFDAVKSMTPQEFKTIFAGIHTYKKDCVFFMNLCEKSKDLNLRDTVEQLFYKKSCAQRFRKLASNDN